MAAKPTQANATCLNKKNSVLPKYFLYAKEPAALYTTSIEISDNKITIPHKNLSPFAFAKRAFPEPCS